MERIPGYRKMMREEIVSDLRSRLRYLRKDGSPNSPEVNLLQKALRLERRVLKARSFDVSDFFTTGYAGRRVILWDYLDGNWSGRLCNRESGIVKKSAVGKTAEEMLRKLMPSR